MHMQMYNRVYFNLLAGLFFILPVFTMFTELLSSCRGNSLQ